MPEAISLLDELGKDLTNHLEALRQSGYLAHLDTVQHGDADLWTSEQNGVTVDWDDKMPFSDTGNHITLEPVFAVTLYTTTLEGEREADRLHQLALIECIPGNKFRGLIPAFIRMRRGYKQQSGQSWRVDYKMQPRVPFRKGGSISTIQTIELTFTSLFSPSQFT